MVDVEQLLLLFLLSFNEVLDLGESVGVLTISVLISFISPRII
jgi:hypothetical protein